jgi:hypothetical protein
MFYYLYEIRNNLNGKIYVGVHQTSSLDDGYMGSGKVIKRAIKKHGLEHFIKTVLEEFQSAEEMFAREKEIVTDEFLLREDVYNLRRGGNGGWDFLNKTGMNNSTKDFESLMRGPLSSSARWKNDKVFAERTAKEWSVLRKKEFEAGVRHSCFSNPEIQKQIQLKSQSDSANEKRKRTYEDRGHQQGEKNSQFGKMWITNEKESVRIKKTDPIPEGWRKGRKINVSL